MKKQTADDIQVRGNGKFLKIDFHGFMGNGVITDGDDVVMAFATQSYSIDLTMSKSQAKAMAEKLAKAAK